MTFACRQRAFFRSADIHHNRSCRKLTAAGDTNETFAITLFAAPSLGTNPDLAEVTYYKTPVPNPVAHIGRARCRTGNRRGVLKKWQICVGHFDEPKWATAAASDRLRSKGWARGPAIARGNHTDC
jgi:hypothetical protein